MASKIVVGRYKGMDMAELEGDVEGARVSRVDPNGLNSLWHS